MVLVFDVAADMAMFRKPYTTTSLVSFPFPPPTAVAGLVGAITGLDHGAARGSWRAEFWHHLAGTQIALGFNREPLWMTTTVNMIKFKSPSGDMSEHIQAKHQLVKKPSYRVYLRGGAIYIELKKRLERGEFVYTPYLGVAWALADIAYVGEINEVEVREEDTWINTVLPIYGGARVDVLRSGTIHRELVPYRLDAERRLKETVNVVYLDFKNKGCLWLKARGNLPVSQVGGERVAWFGAW
ncbi:type I-B CRISPR-associated protein Cas5b [Moorella naiadis]|uniref:type I-B CRISPR-associated protein Cas5b n=1 Tax=Moorella naiadis (nom. illeg.) TaxID=3093670 RepID=UPI003D9CAE67